MTIYKFVLLLLIIVPIKTFSLDAVVFGDSMTRAVFADTIMWPFHLPVKSSDGDAEIQDEVSDWESLLADRPWLSWFDSPYPWSVSNEIGYYKTYNRAVSGAETHNVFSQFNKFIADYPGIEKQKIHAWIMIGPNDICNVKVKNNYRSVRYLIDVIDFMFKNTNWYIIVTDIVDMRQLTKFNNDRGFAGLKCTTIKSYIPACRQFVLGLTAEEQNKRMNAYWDSWNVSIQNMLEGSARGYYMKIFQGFGSIDRKLMAGDCFHPNWLGQKEISKLIKKQIKETPIPTDWKTP